MPRTLRLPVLLAIAVCLACSTVPLTERKQLLLVPSSAVLSTSYEQYAEFMRSHTVVRGTKEAASVETIGRRTQRAVTAYFTQQKEQDRLAGYEWEFNLVEDTSVNAWCMPGGKVAVYTGILPYAEDDTGLSVIIGHEVAHAVARHADERLSQMLALQLGGMALGEALASQPVLTRQIAMTAFGVGAEVGVVLPYSRVQETEADRLGLIFMAMAGYDPRRAVGFWQRMAGRGVAKPPEFLSTHPADETRISNIKKFLPEALDYYNRVEPAARQCR